MNLAFLALLPAALLTPGIARRALPRGVHMRVGLHAGRRRAHARIGLRRGGLRLVTA